MPFQNTGDRRLPEAHQLRFCSWLATAKPRVAEAEDEHALGFALPADISTLVSYMAQLRGRALRACQPENIVRRCVSL